MSEDKTKHWLLRPRTIRGLRLCFAVALSLLALADMFIQPHAKFGVDGTFGFYAWFSFLACMAMVLLAKALGVVLKRPDTFYDD